MFVEDHLSYVTLIDAIIDLPPINANEESNHYLKKPMNHYQKQMTKNSNILLDHNSPNHNSNLINLISHIPEGGTLLDIPENIRPKKAFQIVIADFGQTDHLYNSQKSLHLLVILRV